MIITDKVIYFRLHKTGSTYVQWILQQIHDKHEIIGKHSSMSQVPDDIKKDIDQYIKLGTIRNPWDWYVSLWAFGSMQRGGLYKSMRRGRVKMEQAEWDELYSDPKNPLLFRRWLRELLVNRILPTKYDQNPLGKSLGLMTIRYLDVYTYISPKKFKRIETMEELYKKESKRNYIDLFLRNESLDQNIIENADLLGSTPSEIKRITATKDKKSNSSERDAYTKYYDQESIDLVARMDQLIIDKFGYEF